jgi:hypothetical protein
MGQRGAAGELAVDVGEGAVVVHEGAGELGPAFAGVGLGRWRSEVLVDSGGLAMGLYHA